MKHRRVCVRSLVAASVLCAFFTAFAARHPPIPRIIQGHVFSPGFGVAATCPDSIVIRYSLDDMRLSQRGAREYAISLNGAETRPDDADSGLPVLRRLIAVPNGGAVSVRTRLRASVRLVDFDLVSAPSPRAVSTETPQAKFPLDRQPAVLADVEYVSRLRDQRVACIRVAPVCYVPRQRVLDVATDFEIVVAVDKPLGPVCRSVGPLTSVAAEHVLNFTDTYAPASLTKERPILSGATGSVCWCTGDTWQEAATSAAACQADYLIVVADSLATSTYVDSLAQRRANYNGFNVAIVKISQIDGAAEFPDTVNTPVAIRNMIDSTYTAGTAMHMGDGHLGYVLLLGDAFDSSSRGVIPSYYGYGTGSSNAAASDAYYSFLDDPATDRLPDVLVGRLPVDHDAEEWELRNVVRKIVAYEPLPASAWTDSVLVVSGVSDTDFSFAGQGLAGFQSFFDSVLTYYPYPGASVRQLHRLSLPAGESHHTEFGEKVAASIEAGKWLTAFFDHGFLYYWDGAFYPRNYEFLVNEGKPTVVFSLGSHTCEFDNTAGHAQHYYSPPACCTGPPPLSISCESPGYQFVDPCDVMGERLLVQPAGAIAVIGYSRTQSAPNAQADFASLFRSLSTQNPTTLGELLVGARLFRLTDAITARNLLLLGDPALDIRTRAPAEVDTVDAAIGTGDIRSPWNSYLHSGASPIRVNVRNVWKTDISAIDVELWKGAPEGETSSFLGTRTIDDLPAFGAKVATFTVSGLEGNVELWARVDPDNLISERAENNNVASRKFLALPYDGSYPVRISFGANQSITVSDVSAVAGTELLVGGFNNVACFAIDDTVALWSYATADVDTRIMNSIVAGHFHDSDSSFVALESGKTSFPSKLTILNGQTGGVVKTRAIGDNRFSSAGVVKWCAADLIPADNEMELVSLSYRDAVTDSLFLKVFSSKGPMRSSTLIDDATSVGGATMAVGDLDSDGEKEIVVLGKNSGLKVFSCGATGPSLKWSASIQGGPSSGLPTVVLVNKNAGDTGNLDVLCDGRAPSYLALFDATGTPQWANGPTMTDAHSFSPGDVDGNGQMEVVVADESRIRILSCTNGSTTDTQTVVGEPACPPYLVDVDADGKLDVVVLFQEKVLRSQFEPFEYWRIRLYVLDENLDPLFAVKTFKAKSQNNCAPAVGDLDGDGKFEIVYASPDQYLHVFEIGSDVGNTAWSQRFANDLQTGLNEQTLAGTCTNSTSLYQRTLICGDVSVSAGRTMCVLAGTVVRIALNDAKSMGADPAKVELNIHGRLVADGTQKNPIKFESATPSTSSDWTGFLFDDQSGGGTFDYCEISHAESGIESHVRLVATNCTISTCSNTGVLSVAGGGLIQGCRVSDIGGDGIVVDADSLLIRNTVIDGALGSALKAEEGSSLVIRSSVFENSDTGLFADGAVAAVDVDSACYFYSNDIGIHFYGTGASPVVRNSGLGENTSDAILCSNSSHPLIDFNVIGFNGSGIYCSNNSAPIIQKNSIQASGIAVTATSGANPDVGHRPASTGESTGENNIAHTGKYVVNYNGSGTIYAQYNCWNRNAPNCNPPSNMFTGSVRRDSVRCCDFPRWDDETMIEPSLFLSRIAPPPSFHKLPSTGLMAVIPNPFNPMTTIRYSLAVQGKVEIKIYDVAGRLVQELLDTMQSAGPQSAVWTGIDRRGARVASGVYFVRMVAAGQVFTRKIVMLK